MRSNIERSASKLAAAQHGAVARFQLAALGMSKQTIETKLTRGDWRIADRGVYVVSGSRATWKQRVMVGVLVAGPGAAACNRTAAHLHDLLADRPAIVEVVVASEGRPRSRSGLRIRRTRDLRQPDVTRVAGISVTSVRRTILDVARVLSDVQLEAVLDAALVSGKTSIRAMRQYLKTCGRRRQVVRLLRLLDDREFGVPESELERAFERLIKRNKLPMPVRQERVSRFRADYCYPDHDLLVEVDGSATRSTKAQLQRDRRRQNAIVLERSAPLRFTWDDVTKDEVYVVRTIERALEIRAGGGS